MSWEKRKNGYWIDHDTGKGYVATRGPFESLREAQTEFDSLPHSLRYRLRGPAKAAGQAGTVHAESNAGNVFRHDPPRPFKNNR
jgi:hypothetical protein